MTMARRGMTILGCALSALSTSVQAQAVERAVFLVRQSKDTLAVETATYEKGRAEATLRLRTPVLTLHRVMTISPAGEVLSADMTTGTGPQGDSATTHTLLAITGDSAVVSSVDPAGKNPTQIRRMAVPRGAIPFANLSGQTLELVLRRARAIGGDSVSVPLLLGAGQWLPVRVMRVGKDSAVLSLNNVDIRAHTDNVGRLLGAIIPSQNARFDRLAGDSPAARWSPAALSYNAPAGAPYTAEDVHFKTSSGIGIAGTLTMPKHRAGARVPAVVLITGSGAQDRDEAVPALGNYRPFREIADTLSRRGIAVLRLDDRGVGGSDAGPAAATSADFADDIRAGLAWLRTRADVDAARLGLVGHSEGGIIAPMIAAKDSTLRALVLIAGQARTGREISAFQRKYQIDHEPSIAAGRRAAALEESTREVEKIFAAPGWLHFWADYDPLPAARRIRVPTLILQGETDQQVTPEQAATLAAAIRAGGNRKVTTHLFPRMNHLMLEDASGNPKGYDKLPSYAVRRDFLGVLADWLASTL
ncbi:MAG: hypothetical protein JWM95_2261 [Gemmatimonadetes bacterium]|nr:hypothetical protein [Gemmatimonadota bacterium]